MDKKRINLVILSLMLFYAALTFANCGGGGGGEDGGYTAPAKLNINVQGFWQGHITMDGESIPINFNFDQFSNNLSGDFTLTIDQPYLSDDVSGTIVEDQLTVSVMFRGDAGSYMEFAFSGVVSGSMCEGTWELYLDGNWEGNGQFEIAKTDAPYPSPSPTPVPTATPDPADNDYCMECMALCNESYTLCSSGCYNDAYPEICQQNCQSEKSYCISFWCNGCV